VEHLDGLRLIAVAIAQEPAKLLLSLAVGLRLARLFERLSAALRGEQSSQIRKFPFLREELDPVTGALGRLVTLLDTIGIEAFVPAPLGGPGRPPAKRRRRRPPTGTVVLVTSVIKLEAAPPPSRIEGHSENGKRAGEQPQATPNEERHCHVPDDQGGRERNCRAIEPK
jgi:hypothetical protein